MPIWSQDDETNKTNVLGMSCAGVASEVPTSAYEVEDAMVRQAFRSTSPPLIGTQWAVLEKDWRKHMLRACEPKGPYISKQAAWYPADFNRMLLNAITSKRRSDPPACRGVVSLAPASGDTARASAGQSGSSNDFQEELKIDHFNTSRPIRLVSAPCEHAYTQEVEGAA